MTARQSAGWRQGGVEVKGERKRQGIAILAGGVGTVNAEASEIQTFVDRCLAARAWAFGSFWPSGGTGARPVPELMATCGAASRG